VRVPGKRLPEFSLHMSAHLRDYLIFILDRGLLPDFKTGESECLRHALIGLTPDQPLILTPDTCISEKT
jgi:hypothetical protein